MTFLLYKAFSHFLLPPGLFILLSLAASIIAFRLLQTSAPGKSSLKTRFRYILIPINQKELEKGDCFVVLGGGINEGAPRSLAEDSASHRS